MTPHPLVTQLRFARDELVRCLEGITDDEARHRIMPMNCISWIIGHLATQEQYLWVYNAQGRAIAPDLYKKVGFGQPPSTPPLEEMWDVWRAIARAADAFLDTLTVERLSTHLERNGESLPESIGTLLQRNIYHYWFHIGEAHAIRQMLGHTDLPQFVGDMSQALYRPEL